MEVEFNLTVQDFEAWARYHLKQRGVGVGRNTIYITVLVLLSGGIVASASFRRNRDIIVALVLFFLTFIAVFLPMLVLSVFLRKITIRSASKLSKEDRAHWMFSQQRLAISPAGITSSSAHHETTHGWEIVWKIDITDEYAFLYTAPNEAYVVPRRAFRDKQHFEEFVALARQYQQGPKPTGIITSLPPESTAITRPDAP
jgi:hypothetical protein